MEFYGVSVYIPGAGANSGISAIFPSTSGTSTFSPYQHAHKGKNALTGLIQQLLVLKRASTECNQTENICRTFHCHYFQISKTAIRNSSEFIFVSQLINTAVSVS